MLALDDSETSLWVAVPGALQHEPLVVLVAGVLLPVVGAPPVHPVPPALTLSCTRDLTLTRSRKTISLVTARGMDGALTVEVQIEVALILMFLLILETGSESLS